MSSLRSILAATDLSPPSRHAADRAAQLARGSGATLTLVHALSAAALEDLRRWLGHDTETAAMVQADARDRLHEAASELEQRHRIDVAEQLSTGHPVEVVTHSAEELDADLLVTGTRGAGFLRGMVVGATAERIAKRSQRPVLMARQSAHEPYRRVLVPVDFSPWSVAAIDLAVRIAPDASLILMHAIDLPFEGKLRFAGVDDSSIARYRDNARLEAWTQLGEVAARAGLARERIRLATPSGADPWMLIVQQEQEFDCDLIVIGKQGRNMVGDLLLGSTTRMVMLESHADVLVSVRREPPALSSGGPAGN
jgi:nucleotide-binding universal stress UspA family protein